MCKVNDFSRTHKQDFQCCACRRTFSWNQLSGHGEGRRICETCISRRSAPCPMCDINTL